MVKLTAAGPGHPADPRRPGHPYERARTGRQHAINRVAKLNAVTVVRGAAPAEAEFAGRRARCLIAQFGLNGQGSSPANIDFRPSAAPAKSNGAISPSEALAAAAAYRPFDRRKKSALRFVELA